MKITHVEVEVHEKRNHPYEYGHYDASVRLCADVDDTDGVHAVIDELRDIARWHVKTECDQWRNSLSTPSPYEDLLDAEGVDDDDLPF